MSVTAPVSFSKVRTEFGAGSAYLSAYVRGGAIVPNHANTAGIPTTAAGMKLSDFLNSDVDAPISNHTSSISTTVADGLGSCSSAPGCSSYAATANVTVSITSGGVGPYTYSWAKISGGTMSISGASTASAYWYRTSPPGSVTATYRCTITDTGNSNYQTTHDCEVTLENEYAP